MDNCLLTLHCKSERTESPFRTSQTTSSSYDTVHKSVPKHIQNDNLLQFVCQCLQSNLHLNNLYPLHEPLPFGTIPIKVMRVINFWLQIYSLSVRPLMWRLMVIGHLKIARFPEISWLKQKLIGTILLSDQFFGIPIQTKCHKWTSNRSVKKYFRRPYDNAANGQFTYQGEFTVSY